MTCTVFAHSTSEWSVSSASFVGAVSDFSSLRSDGLFSDICPELSHLWQGADVIHFGDNNAANSAAIKGVSGARDLSRLALILHSSLASSATRIWIERVCSDGNIADEPSCGDIDTLVSMGAVELGFAFPDLLARAGLVP